MPSDADEMTRKATHHGSMRLQSTVDSSSVRDITKAIMKKRSTTTAKSSPPKRPSKSAPLATNPSAAETAESSTRLEVITIPPLATFEPPRISELRPIRFEYAQPEASAVYLAGSFNGWNPEATPFTRDSLGVWSVELGLPAGEHRYRFIVDGEWRDDPLAQQMVVNPFGGFDGLLVVV